MVKVMGVEGGKKMRCLYLCRFGGGESVGEGTSKRHWHFHTVCIDDGKVEWCLKGTRF